MASSKTLREKLYNVVFRSDNPAGNRFDIIIIYMIIISVIMATVETVGAISPKIKVLLRAGEWFFTVLFTIEYLIRLYSARDRWKYVTSFFGIIDLLAILPSYIGIFITGGQSLLFIRLFRLMRIFRIFEMGHFVREGSIVANALKASRVKITVFLTFITIASVVLGAMMYMVEVGHNDQITNVPEGIYWAIVTLTTVGYGDAIPVTGFGKFLASLVMILGYGVIAVPTGIVTAEITNRVLGPRDRLKTKCLNCGDGDHLFDSDFCHKCGHALPEPKKN
ncbi:MAG: ion transporter [Saprospiraceae bacterium]